MERLNRSLKISLPSRRNANISPSSGQRDVWRKLAVSLLNPTAVFRSRRRRVMTYVIRGLLDDQRTVSWETQGKRRSTALSRWVRVENHRAIQLSLSPALSRRVDTHREPARPGHVHRGRARRDAPSPSWPRAEYGPSSRGALVVTACRNNAPYFSQPQLSPTTSLRATVTRDVRPGIN